MIFRKEKDEPCMNIIKKAVESHQRAQTISILAIGISVFALIAVLAIAGGRNAAR